MYANLLLSPEAFDANQSPWFAFQLTVSPDATADPFGQSRADKLVPSAVSSQHYLVQGTTRGAIQRQDVFSIFLKAGELNAATLYLNDGSGYAVLDITNVTAGTASASNLGSGLTGVTSGNADAEGGWRRFWISAVMPAATTVSNVQIFPSSANTYLGNAADGLYAFGAKLEVGGGPSVYNPPQRDKAIISARPLLRALRSRGRRR